MSHTHDGLVHPERIFGVVQRLYTGHPDEILGEMLQNAQRAGASSFDVRIEDDLVKFSDNGKGIEGDLEGFRTLLSIADSHYSPEVEAEQAPMGVGFYSLLSNQDVRQVRVDSAGKSLTIDTRRWFTDHAYRRNWTDLIAPSSIRTGMVIEVVCGEKFRFEINRLFKPEWSRPLMTSGLPPWAGYGNFLAIRLNDTLLPAELPEFLKLQPLLETEYLGNRLTIGFSPDSNHPHAGSYVNWFGQLVKIDGLGNGLNLYLEVTRNVPVTPKSPTRSGIVQDRKWDAFKGFVLERLREYYEGQTSPPPVRVLEAGYWLFPELHDFLPWLIVRKAKPGRGCDFESRFAPSPAEILPKGGDFLLLKPEIDVLNDEGRPDTLEGLEAFLPLLEQPAFFLERGSAPVYTLTWKPGPLVRNDLGVEIRERGEFSVVSEGTPPEWKPVDQDVYAFFQPVAWEIEEAMVILGAKDPVSTIWAAANAVFDYDPEIEDSRETTYESFKGSVSSIVRALLGNVVPNNFSKYDLLEFVPKGDSLDRIEFLREQGNPKGLRLVFGSGATREVGFY